MSKSIKVEVAKEKEGLLGNMHTISLIEIIVKQRRQNKNLLKKIDYWYSKWNNSVDYLNGYLEQKNVDHAQELKDKETEFAKKLEEKDAILKKERELFNQQQEDLEEQKAEIKNLKQQIVDMGNAGAKILNSIAYYHEE